MLSPGDKAPAITLPDAESGAPAEVDWTAGPTVVAFYKSTCPVCQMVAPKLTLLADGGARVIGVGQDPPETLQRYATNHGQHIPTLSEAPPYEVSNGFGISAVPTLFLVGPDGVVQDAVGNWDRARWNALAEAAGGAPISDESDGLPVFRPG